MTIFLIAIGVFLVAVAIWFIRVFADGRKQRRRIEEFQQDIARQERTVNEKSERPRPQSRFGLFDSSGKRAEINPGDFVLYVRTPTTIKAIELDFEGELRDSRGIRRFTYGDYFCENEYGCQYITAAPYMRIGYEKVKPKDDDTKTWPTTPGEVG